MYICLQKPKLTSVISCQDTFHARSRAMEPRCKGNAWIAIHFLKACYESQGRFGLITSENIYRKTLQLPETAKNKGSVHFQEEQSLEFGCQEVEICNILSHVVTQLLDRRSRASPCNFTRASIGSDNGSLGGYLLNLTSKEVMRWMLCLNTNKHALVQRQTNFTAPLDDNKGIALDKKKNVLKLLAELVSGLE